MVPPDQFDPETDLVVLEDADEDCLRSPIDSGGTLPILKADVRDPE